MKANTVKPAVQPRLWLYEKSMSKE